MAALSSRQSDRLGKIAFMLVYMAIQTVLFLDHAKRAYDTAVVTITRHDGPNHLGL